MAIFSNVSEAWERNHPWAALYSFGVDRELVARPIGKLLMGTDLRLLYEATEAVARQPEGAAILDIPCGSGVALRGLRNEQRVRYVAADISEAMLERTRRTAERKGLDQVETRQADVEALPFADGEFDLCVSLTGLHCFPDPRQAVLELGRVVRAGGELTGSVFLTDGGRRYVPQVKFGRAMGVLGPSGSGPDVVAWLGEAGFEDIELVRSGPLGYFTATRG